MQNNTIKALVVDDELAIRQILGSVLKDNGYAVDVAESGEAARKAFANNEYDVCLCDVRLGDCIGIDLVREFKKSGLETEFIIMTAFASVSTAIDAMKAGAFDYLMKPMRNEDVLHRLDKVAQMLSLKKENRNLRRLVSDKAVHVYTPKSDVMQRVTQLIEKLARSDRDVIITGESGTGKGVTAREIHQLSSRSHEPFVQVNCAALPENLMESELFGHVKGAFTGADRNKTGLFQEANGGMIFLDEIGEMPLAMQAKVLHVIEEKSIRPVGGNHQISVDVRIITATNRDLQKMVDEGTFREDLFFRLQILQIELPPLRERFGDIEPLIQFFIDKECQRAGLNQQFEIDDDAMECLMNYSYPGNLREMENALARAVALAEDNKITTLDLPTAFVKSQSEGLNHEPTLRELLRDYEYKVIKDTLLQCNNDRRKAAKKLGVGLSSLYRKLEEINENDEE